MISSKILNIDQSSTELNQIHGEKDYYWYLRSPEFLRDFITPLANVVNELGGRCLDVACGEGYLCELVKVPYFGFDGSLEAVQKATSRYGLHFLRGRIEEFGGLDECWQFDTVVFGGVLQVLVKEEFRLELLQAYQKRFGVKHFVIYDLATLDVKPFSPPYRLLSNDVYQTDLQGIEEIKTKRRIAVLQCEP